MSQFTEKPAAAVNAEYPAAPPVGAGYGTSAAGYGTGAAEYTAPPGPTVEKLEADDREKRPLATQAPDGAPPPTEGLPR